MIWRAHERGSPCCRRHGRAAAAPAAGSSGRGCSKRKESGHAPSGCSGWPSLGGPAWAILPGSGWPTPGWLARSQAAQYGATDDGRPLHRLARASGRLAWRPRFCMNSTAFARGRTLSLWCWCYGARTIGYRTLTGGTSPRASYQVPHRLYLRYSPDSRITEISGKISGPPESQSVAVFDTGEAGNGAIPIAASDQCRSSYLDRASGTRLLTREIGRRLSSPRATERIEPPGGSRRHPLRPYSCRGDLPVDRCASELHQRGKSNSWRNPPPPASNRGPRPRPGP
jgi:hypothetical protein